MTAPAALYGGAPLMEGVRIIELAEWTFVPSAGMVLAELGADVIKVEHPIRGDAQHGLTVIGAGTAPDSPNLFMEQTNRGKRSVGIDVKHARGRDLVVELVKTADVFLTSLRAPALQRLGLGPETLRATKPDLIYARGHGQGAQGPDADSPAYDTTAYWARSGLAHAITSAAGAPRPVRSRPAMGDRAGSMNLAFGIAAALLRRERTGAGAVVDVSLLATGMWTVASDLVYSAANPGEQREFLPQSNPLVGDYRTADGRWITFSMLASDRWWPNLCETLRCPHLRDDPRFATAEARSENAQACADVLAAVMEREPLAIWLDRFEALTGPWAVLQTLDEAVADPQAAANGYVLDMPHDMGSVRVIPSPVHFDGAPALPLRSPEAWQHTEEVLLELGATWDELTELKNERTIA